MDILVAAADDVGVEEPRRKLRTREITRELILISIINNSDFMDILVAAAVDVGVEEPRRKLRRRCKKNRYYYIIDKNK